MERARTRFCTHTHTQTRAQNFLIAIYFWELLSVCQLHTECTLKSLNIIFPSFCEQTNSINSYDVIWLFSVSTTYVHSLTVAEPLFLSHYFYPGIMCPCVSICPILSFGLLLQSPYLTLFVALHRTFTSHFAPTIFPWHSIHLEAEIPSQNGSWIRQNSDEMKTMWVIIIYFVCLLIVVFHHFFSRSTQYSLVRFRSDPFYSVSIFLFLPHTLSLVHLHCLFGIILCSLSNVRPLTYIYCYIVPLHCLGHQMSFILLINWEISFILFLRGQLFALALLYRTA